MGWVLDKIEEIGIQRLLQDLHDEIDAIPDKEDYLYLLVQDLELTLNDYEDRYADEIGYNSSG